MDISATLLRSDFPFPIQKSYKLGVLSAKPPHADHLIATLLPTADCAGMCVACVARCKRWLHQGGIFFFSMWSSGSRAKRSRRTHTTIRMQGTGRFTTIFRNKKSHAHRQKLL